jgi:two-component system sensor histidine kinase HydH
MLAAMSVRRVPPLAVAFALIAAALVATTWVTRKAVNAAFTAARDGEALAIEQAVRGDLAELEAPDAAQLQILMKDHAGLRYIGLLDGRGHVVVSAGTPIAGEGRVGRRQIIHVGGRIRIEMRTPFRRAGPGFVIEVEPIEADQLRSSADVSLAIGGIAALVMLGVAIALVRRELQRRAEEQLREREKRLAALGEMSAVLAHEIKNPLASLKGNAQLLAQMLAKTLPEGDKPRAKAERVVDEAVRLEQLTNDLLHFVRTGAIKRTPVDPGAIVREAAASVASTSAHLGEVTIDTDRAPASWSLDAGRIREVVVNLVDNAVAAGPPVTVTVAGERAHLVIEIADQGPGVPEAERDKIFEPFFTGKTQGTGLGLAVARRVVELHGGTLAVLTSPRGGALFRAEIPES